MTKPPSSQGLPRHYVVRETLRREIVETMKPGDQLPTEPELTRRMGVSRITVRYALDQLKAEGLITTAHGRGTFVAFPSVRPNLRGLSSFLKDIYASGQQPGTDVVRIGPSRGRSKARQRLGVPLSEPLVCVEKIRLADGDPISYEKSFVLSTIAGRWTAKLIKEMPIFDILTKQQIRLSWADVEVAADLATDHISQFLKVKKGAALLRVERLVYDAEDRPIEFDVLYYRSDRVRYSFQARSEAVNPNLDAKAGFKLVTESVGSEV